MCEIEILLLNDTQLRYLFECFKLYIVIFQATHKPAYMGRFL